VRARSSAMTRFSRHSRSQHRRIQRFARVRAGLSFFDDNEADDEILSLGFVGPKSATSTGTGGQFFESDEGSNPGAV
jgi:hypothetical protein